MSLNSTSPRQIQKFGLVAFIFFGFLCTLGIWRDKIIPVYLFGFLSITGLGFILLPNFLSPVYLAWLKGTQFLSRVVTTFVLSLTYYLVITPMALVGRILGRTFLPQKPDPNIASYWVLRDEASQPKERFSKRY